MNKKLMKQVILGLIISITLLSFTVPEWKSYRNIDGMFKVLTRGAFQEKTIKAQTSIGEITTKTFIYQPKEQEENLVYMVTYYDFPKGSMHSDSTTLLDDFFKTTIEQSAESVSGTVIYSNQLEQQGHRAWQWRVNYGENKVAIKTRAFLIGTRFYSVQTVGLSDAPNNNTSEFFMNSLKILGLEEKY
jgi:hypothetical protein